MTSVAADSAQRRLFHHFDRLTKALSGCDEATANWKPGPNTNSVFTLVAHTIAVAEAHVITWIGGEKIAGPSREELFASSGTIKDLQARAEEVKARIAARIARFTDAELMEPRENRVGCENGLEILMHAAAHAAEHAGQAELTRDLALARADG